MAKKERKKEKIKKPVGSSIKIGIGFAVLVVVVAGWLLFYYQPTSRMVKTLNRNVQKWALMIRAASVSENKIEKLEKEVTELNANVDQIEKKIYPISKMPSIGKKIIRLGRRHHLAVLAMTPSYNVLFPVKGVSSQDKPMVKLPVTFIMRGRYINLGHFLEDVPKLPFAFAVDEVHLGTDPSIYPNIDIQLKGYFFLLTKKAQESPGVRGSQALL
ncbi:MAG: type 4a pilus biogenesis protein PilO [Calditrichaeota bacterium]|nr:type 4a pilus biogenesis protein PilO [Calditrichota bacterium]